MTLFFWRKSPRSSSGLSEFVRNASSSDKKRIYKKVLERATERQRAVVERATHLPPK